MKKFFSIKDMLILGTLLLILITLAPKWFIPKIQDVVVNTIEKPQVEKNPIEIQPIKLPEEALTPSSLSKNTSSRLASLASEEKSKDLPDLWCIVFSSFKSYKQFKEFAKKLKDNKIPVFFRNKENHILDPINPEVQAKKEIIVGPEIDKTIIEKYLKKLEILGIKGKITKFNIL